MWGVWIAIGILALAIFMLVLGYIRIAGMKPKEDIIDFTIPNGDQITFKGAPGEIDWVICRDGNKLITGTKQGNIIKQKSVI